MFGIDVIECCEKCAIYPCTCGNDYRNWTNKQKLELISKWTNKDIKELSEILQLPVKIYNPVVKLGKWSKINKSWRQVLLNGSPIGEVHKSCMWSPQLGQDGNSTGKHTYKESAKVLAEHYISLNKNKTYRIT